MGRFVGFNVVVEVNLWFDGVIVRASDSLSRGRRFDSWPYTTVK